MFSTTMFSLFLLSAAAGVNAILGGEVRGIQITDKEYICADDCVYRNIYLTQSGEFCPVEEVIVRKEEDPKIEAVDFDCKRTPPPTWYTQVPLSSGQKPSECYVYQMKTDGQLACTATKTIDGKKPKMVSWKEIEKELPSAKSEGEQGTPEKNKPAPQKPKRPLILTPKDKECADKTRPKFNACEDDTCRENIRQEFRECRNNKDKSTPEKKKPAPQKPKQPLTLTPKQQECADKTVPKHDACKDETCRKNIRQEFIECMSR